MSRPRGGSARPPEGYDRRRDAAKPHQLERQRTSSRVTTSPGSTGTRLTTTSNDQSRTLSVSRPNSHDLPLLGTNDEFTLAHQKNMIQRRRHVEIESEDSDPDQTHHVPVKSPAPPSPRLMTATTTAASSIAPARSSPEKLTTQKSFGYIMLSSGEEDDVDEEDDEDDMQIQSFTPYTMATNKSSQDNKGLEDEKADSDSLPLPILGPRKAVQPATPTRSADPPSASFTPSDPTPSAPSPSTTVVSIKKTRSNDPTNRPRARKSTGQLYLKPPPIASSSSTNPSRSAQLATCSVPATSVPRLHSTISQSDLRTMHEAQRSIAPTTADPTIESRVADIDKAVVTTPDTGATDPSVLDAGESTLDASLSSHHRKRTLGLIEKAARPEGHSSLSNRTTLIPVVTGDDEEEDVEGEGNEQRIGMDFQVDAEDDDDNDEEEDEGEVLDGPRRAELEKAAAQARRRKRRKEKQRQQQKTKNLVSEYGAERRTSNRLRLGLGQKMNKFFTMKKSKQRSGPKEQDARRSESPMQMEADSDMTPPYVSVSTSMSKTISTSSSIPMQVEQEEATVPGISAYDEFVARESKSNPKDRQISGPELADEINSDIRQSLIEIVLSAQRFFMITGELASESDRYDTSARTLQFEMLIAEANANELLSPTRIRVIPPEGGNKPHSPPFDFVYTNRVILPDGSAPEQAESCSCIGNCGDPKNLKRCACKRRQVDASRTIGTRNARSNHTSFAWGPGRILNENVFNDGDPIWECNSLCGCDETCVNRVVGQKRSIDVDIFWTGSMTGWGVRNPPTYMLAPGRSMLDGSKTHFGRIIKRGEPLAVYAGQLISTSELIERSDLYEYLNRNYIFELDSFHIAESWARQKLIEEYGYQLSRTKMKRIPTRVDSLAELFRTNLEKREEGYAIDAFLRGNWTRFCNHSCARFNAIPRAVYVDEGRPDRPLFVFIASQDILPGEEIRISYYSEDKPMLEADQTFQDFKDAANLRRERAPTEFKCFCGDEMCRGIMFQYNEDEDSSSDVEQGTEAQDKQAGPSIALGGNVEEVLREGLLLDSLGDSITKMGQVRTDKE